MSDAQRTRILVVDDERSLTRILRSMLEHDGHQVEECSNTDGLIERIAAEPPDLAILDYHMPGMSGVAVLEAIRQRLGERVPVIILTGESENIEVAVQTLKLGALDYLVKPVAMERLLSSVRSVLRMHALRMEARRLAIENAALWEVAGPTLVVGADARIRRLNAAAERALARSPDGICGKALDEVPALSAALPSVLAALAGVALPGAGTEDPAGNRCLRLGDDEVLLSLAPVAAAPGQAPRLLARRGAEGRVKLRS